MILMHFWSSVFLELYFILDTLVNKPNTWFTGSFVLCIYQLKEFYSKQNTYYLILLYLPFNYCKAKSFVCILYELQVCISDNKEAETGHKEEEGEIKLA